VQLAQKRAERAAKQQEQVSKTGASGQWVRPPEPPKPDPTLTQRLIKTIGTVKGLTPIAAEIEAGASLDLDGHTIQVLRKSLRDQNTENTALSKALGAELSRRKAIPQ
jgi:triphosphoribosyl-dephospho-CoA synthetase